MCGIAAVFAYGAGAPAVDRASLGRTAQRMACRGPDGCGDWYSADGRVGLAHRRLAIIDLSPHGAQPMRGAGRGHVISFNGEIYNFAALRSALEAKGRRFESGSDTEVLLQLYAERGPAMVHELRGMFAFAIWDEQARALFLARDPFGIKPLYYADDGSTLRVASEVKALLAGARAEIDTRPDPAGHVGFHLWGSVPDPHTMYRGIRALPAGTTLLVDARGAGAPRQYADLGTLVREAATAARECPANAWPSAGAHDALRDALVGSVRAHLVSDVPVGVFLSAGLDSTTIAALASEERGSIRTVTLGFEEYRGTEQDEVPLAEAVARQHGTDHTTVWISRSDFDGELERLLDRMDQPTIDGVNSYFVARAAAEVGLKVALSGLGGDELFGGYPSFRQIPPLVRAVGRVPSARAIGRTVRRVMVPAIRGVTSQKYAALLEYGGDFAGAYLLRRSLLLPWELPEVLAPELVREGLSTLAPLERLEQAVRQVDAPRWKVSVLEAAFYMRNQLLRDTDWAGMSASLEVRVPLADWPLWQTVAALGGRGAAPTKRDMALTPRMALPPEVLARAKTGFSVPTRDWLAAQGGAHRATRGLRGWASLVYAAHRAEARA